MNSLNQKSMNFNKKVKINFDGGDLSSDSGLLMYKEFHEKIGFSKVIKENITIEDDVNHRIHENEHVIIQKIYQIIDGYNTDDSSDKLRLHPTFTTVLDKEKLASQPTLSKPNNILDKNTSKQLGKINKMLLGI